MLDSLLDVLLWWLGGRTVWARTLNPEADRQYETSSPVAVPELPGLQADTRQMDRTAMPDMRDVGRALPAFKEERNELG